MVLLGFRTTPLPPPRPVKPRVQPRVFNRNPIGPSPIRGRFIPPPRIPPGSGGASWIIPAGPLLPGLPPWAWFALGWLAYELLFPEEVADGTFDTGNPLKFKPTPWTWISQPVPEREDAGLVVPRLTFQYLGVTSLSIETFFEVFKGQACPGGFAEPGKIIQNQTKSFSFNTSVVPSTIEAEVNSPKVNYNCGGSAGNNDIVEEYPFRVRQLDGDGNQVGDWQVFGTPQPQGESFESSNSGGRQWVAYVWDTNYADPSTYPPELPPGPITPQPDPFPPAPITTPVRRTLPDIEAEPMPQSEISPIKPQFPTPTIAPPLEPGPGPTTVPSPPVNPSPAPPPTLSTPVKPISTIGTGPDGVPTPPKPGPLSPTKPNVHFPVDPGTPVFPGGAKPSLPSIANEVGRIEQKTERILKTVRSLDFEDIAALIGLLSDLMGFFPEGKVPSTTYSIEGVCETVSEDESQPIYSEILPEVEYGQAVLDRLDALPALLQQHLAFKTPTCGGSTRPKLEGDWVSIRFVSDAPSPNSNRPLRKLFRYRSKSSAALDQLREHWAGFTWQAGPVCIGHADGWWGTPQIWAISIDEGKRVLRHAAGEAGINPDQDGRWVVSSSRSPRYGMPGKMRIEQYKGIDWITNRDSPSGWPEI